MSDNENMENHISFVYAAILDKQPDGGYLVQFPDFPEAITQGEDKIGALSEAADCLEEAVANRIVKGLDIPKSSQCDSNQYPIPLHITLAAKCALYLAMKKHKLSKVALAKKLGCDEKEVRRLLDPKFRSRILRIEEALNLLGEKIILTVSSNSKAA